VNDERVELRCSCTTKTALLSKVPDTVEDLRTTGIIAQQEDADKSELSDIDEAIVPTFEGPADVAVIS
jgi:hypothetical protein